jgi:hypothetical protein
MRVKPTSLPSVLTFVLILAASTWGSENTVQEEIPYFTNKDIRQYKQPSDGEIPVTDGDRKTEKDKRSQKIKEDREKEYWCKKAGPYRKKIDRTRDEIQATEKALSESSLTPKKKKTLNRKLQSSRKKLQAPKGT